MALEHITKRILYVSIHDMIRLLKDRSLTLPQGETSKQDPAQAVTETKTDHSGAPSDKPGEDDTVMAVIASRYGAWSEQFYSHAIDKIIICACHIIFFLRTANEDATYTHLIPKSSQRRLKPTV